MTSAKAYQIAIALNTVAADAIQQLLDKGYSQEQIIRSYTIPALTSALEVHSRICYHQV